MYNHVVIEDVIPLDIFRKVSRAEGDTLLRFYGVVVCVGELGFIGYLALASEVRHFQWSGFYLRLSTISRSCLPC
jgi:Na+/H+ antiporter NhaD/arsenite permease-like protein